MKKIVMLALIVSLFNGCMVKRILNGGKGGGHHDKSSRQSR